MSIECAVCGEVDNSQVIETRKTQMIGIRRRRRCLGCGYLFTTHEKVDALTIYVIKRHRPREAYDPKKLLSTLNRSLKLLPNVRGRERSELFAKIEKRIVAEAKDNEISSRHIGRIILEEFTKDSRFRMAYLCFGALFLADEDPIEFMDLSFGLEEKLERVANQRH